MTQETQPQRSLLALALPQQAAEAASWLGFAGEPMQLWPPALPTPGLAHPAYGETLIGTALLALQRLERSRAPHAVLVLPSPHDADAGQRALALCGVEALRRFGMGCCTWPDAATDGSAAWRDIAGSDTAALLRVLFAGLRADAVQVPRQLQGSMSPTVSVIVRSMDRSSLAQALDSVAAQTYPAIELVIVNARGAAHRPLPTQCGAFPVVTVGGEQGQPLTRAVAANHGLQRASGAMALFLDDDDLLLPDHLSRLVQALDTRTDAVAAYAGVEMGQDGDCGWQPLHRFDAPFDATRLLFENYLPMHGVLFRRGAAVAALRLDEAFDLFEDWDWWLQLAALGPFMHVPGVSARYRITGAQQSDVFADTAGAADARARLFEKWRRRMPAQQYVQLLTRAQALHREAAQRRDQIELAQRSETYLRDVVAAREREVKAAQEQAAALQAVIDERDHEIASLKLLLQAREGERDNAVAHSANLASVIAARDQEVADAAAHASELGKIVAARDDELAHVRAELCDARAELANTRAALQDNRSTLQDTRSTLQDTRSTLQELRNETLPQALMRSLRKKEHGPSRG